MKEVFARLANLIYLLVIHDSEAYVMRDVPNVTVAPVINPKSSNSLSAVVMYMQSAKF